MFKGHRLQLVPANLQGLTCTRHRCSAVQAEVSVRDDLPKSFEAEVFAFLDRLSNRDVYVDGDEGADAPAKNAEVDGQREDDVDRDAG